MAVGDGCFQLGDALGDPAAQRGGDVVVFEVEQLAGQAPFEVGDLGFEPLGPLGGQGRVVRLGGCLHAVPPVVRSAGAEQRGSVPMTA